MLSRVHRCISRPRALFVQTRSYFVRDKKNEKPAPPEIPRTNPVPVCVRAEPIEVNNLVAQKKYRWCACGLSKNQPFCDNSHKGTSFVPRLFVLVEKQEKCYLCMCKYTSKAPFCDGTCKTLNPEDLSEAAAKKAQVSSDPATSSSS
eukprot:GILI01012868.1.p1 GENE.GILI01012868.1~~GILI01012868.1.p1  ORF type:complete len:162 (-),score=17.24 GILI01012868.1:82-522(-)